MYSLITLPDPTVILASSSPWFTAWIGEYMPYLYIGGGVVLAFAMIRLLIGIWEWGMFRLSSEYRMNVLRNEARDIIVQNQQIDTDFELWKRSQK